MRVVVVTGVSGAGKSTALRALEDLGYYCVDNLPSPLIGKFVDLAQGSGLSKAALVIDTREGEFLLGAGEAIRLLKTLGLESLEVLFLDAPDDVLKRRFSATRRRHPLSAADLDDGLRRERQLLKGLREEADVVIDTGALSVHDLKRLVVERYGRGGTVRLGLAFVSFSYKVGIPTEADVVLDVRFLPNPYFVERLAPRNGLDPEVARYVLENDVAREFLGHVVGLLKFMVVHCEAEGKAYLTIAVGCTGGRHRSVAVAEELARHVGEGYAVSVRHRDVERSG